MPTTYTNTCLVYQTETQSNPCAVANSELDAGGKPLQLFHSKNIVTTVKGQTEE
jgi:hypothetical protein